MKAQPQALGAVLCVALTIGVARVDTGYRQTKLVSSPSGS
jgi:hypothetical protein